MAIVVTIAIVIFLLLALYYPVLALLTVWLAPLVKRYLMAYVPIFRWLDFTVLSLVVLMFALIFRYLTRPSDVRLHGPGLALFLALMVWSGLSYLWGPQTPKCVEFFTKGTLIGTAFFLAPMFYIRSPSDAERLLKAIFIACGVLAVLTVFFTSHILPWRATALAANPLSVAMALNMGILGGLALALRAEKGQWLRRVCWLAIPLMAVGIFMTGSRGPLLVGALAVLLFLLLVRRRIGLTRWMTLAVTVGLAVVGVALLVPELYLSRFVTIFRGAEAMRTRFVLWSITWPDIMESPVLGHGLGSFAERWVGRGVGGKSPHNLILEVWHDAGVLGLLLVIVLLGVTAYVGYRTVRRLEGHSYQVLAAALLCMFAIYVGEYMKSGSWIEFRFLWLCSSLCLTFSRAVGGALPEVSPGYAAAARHPAPEPGFAASNP